VIRVEDGRLYVSGPATLANATQLLEEARAPLAGGVAAVDLGGVTEVDSSLLAVLFAWMREARRRGGSLAVTHLPGELKSLAQLYGVAELLPQETEN
jgi:phospholipid transport system transporter-binding protein